MIRFSVFFIIGDWLFQQQASLPELKFGWLMLSFIPAWYMSVKYPRMSIVTLPAFAMGCGFFYASWHAEHRLRDHLPEHWQGVDIIIRGTVQEMPRLNERGVSFIFEREQILTRDAYVPRKLLLTAYYSDKHPTPVFHAGERWQLTVRLKQPHGSSNPHTSNFEQWAMERNLRAIGYVSLKGEHQLLDQHAQGLGHEIERWRENIRNRIREILPDSPYAGILSALSIGDQASINSSQWQIFTRTGINHLMSISGLHITMLAGLFFILINRLWRFFPALCIWLPSRKAAITAGLITAFMYAQLSGFGVPAQRTVFMLASIAFSLWFYHNQPPSRHLALAILTVVLLDPWAVSAAGFWLSFGAVSLIFFVTANRLKTSHWLIEYTRIQWAMSLGLIPLLLALFQQISLISPIANAISIPLVSIVVVPLVLAGSLVPLDWPLHLSNLILGWLMPSLEWLSQLQASVWTQHAPPVWTVLIAFIGIFWILMPAGFPTRWAGTILLLPLFLIQIPSPDYGNARIVVFDVGQGLAVSIQTRNHALLYDSGPAYNSESNSGNRILAPSMKGNGIRRLDKLILTHDDTDHTGGALSVLSALETREILSSLPDDHELLSAVSTKYRCADGQQWQWDGVWFEILHPDQNLSGTRQKTNNLGCVLRVSTGNHSLLLTADIEKKSEKRLLSTRLNKLQSDIMVVPHHGSKTSSTQEFIAAVNPSIAIFSAGYRNVFGHPKPEILQRYEKSGSQILRTDREGAIHIAMSHDNLLLNTQRKLSQRYWMHRIVSEE